LFFTILTSACKNQFYCPTQSESNSEENLIGAYELYSTTDSIQTFRTSLRFALNTYSETDTVSNWEDLSYRIDTAKKSLQLIGSIGDSVVFNHTLKGKWKDDYFKSKSKVRVRGLPFIYFSSYKSRIYICSDADKIYVQKSVAQYGNIFFFSAGHTFYYIYEFPKLQ
jgi:hypothetical protein